MGGGVGHNSTRNRQHKHYMTKRFRSFCRTFAFIVVREQVYSVIDVASIIRQPDCSIYLSFEQAAAVLSAFRTKTRGESTCVPYSSFDNAFGGARRGLATPWLSVPMRAMLGDAHANLGLNAHS